MANPHSSPMFSGWENPNLLFFLSAGLLGTTSSSEFLISELEFEHSKCTAWDASGKHRDVWGFWYFLLMFCSSRCSSLPKHCCGNHFPFLIFLFYAKLGCAVMAQLQELGLEEKQKQNCSHQVQERHRFFF